MPPQAQPKAKGAAAKAEAKGAKAEAPLPDFEALNEEEVTFCWLSLVDKGQLSAQKLQQFMLEVCGERLSNMQARDLLNYMDANGDGIVGREDFRNFVSVGRMEDTDPKDFMWTPKRKYREEHGTSEKQQAKDEDLPPVSVGMQAAASFFSRDDRQRTSVEMPGGSAGLGAAGAGANASTSSSSNGPTGSADPAHRIAASGVALHESKAPEPKPPPGKRRGPAGGRGARTAAAAAAAEAAAAAALAASLPGSRRQRRHVQTPAAGWGMSVIIFGIILSIVALLYRKWEKSQADH